MVRIKQKMQALGAGRSLPPHRVPCRNRAAASRKPGRHPPSPVPRPLWTGVPWAASVQTLVSAGWISSQPRSGSCQTRGEKSEHIHTLCFCPSFWSKGQWWMCLNEFPPCSELTWDLKLENWLRASSGTLFLIYWPFCNFPPSGSNVQRGRSWRRLPKHPATHEGLGPRGHSRGDMAWSPVDHWLIFLTLGQSSRKGPSTQGVQRWLIPPLSRTQEGMGLESEAWTRENQGG